MKILHVTQGYTPAVGGTELVMQRVSEELVGQFGDEVAVFTTNCYSGDAFYTPGLKRMPAGSEVINGVRVRRFPVQSRFSQLFRPFRPSLRPSRFPGNQYFRTLFNGPIIPGLGKAIREAEFDLLAASSFPLLHMFVALQAAHGTRRPMVMMGGLHPQDEWGFQRPMIYRAIAQADHYIAYTRYEADYVIARGADPKRVSVIGLGVDLPAFEQTETQEAKRRLEVGAAPVVGFIGQIGAHKGVDTLLRAMPLVWQVVPEAKFLIAGARTLYDPSLQQALAQMPEQSRQNVILRYNFPNEEKPWLFAALDVFVYPSGFESFGISFVEAWAVKKPVIGCRRGAVPWVVDAGRNGLLVEFQNEGQLAEAIIALLKNRAWAESLGVHGYQKAITHHYWPEVGRRFHRVYAETLAQYRQKAT